MEGTAFTFGDHINTDVITPSDYFDMSIDGMAAHVFEPIRPTVASEISDGDLVVAGKNFGAGSARETATAALKAAGISVVVAESFARIFYRNSIAIGLPVVTCPRVTEIVSDGDRVNVNLDSGTVTNVTTDEDHPCESMPEPIRKIFEKGGLVKYFNTSQGRPLDME